MHSPAVEHNPTRDKCPDRDVLSELVLGKLPGEAIDRLCEHIKACSTCQGVLDTLDDLEDSVVSDLKAASGVMQSDPELEQQIREAAMISPAVWDEQADGEAKRTVSTTWRWSTWTARTYPVWSAAMGHCRWQMPARQRGRRPWGFNTPTNTGWSTAT